MSHERHDAPNRQQIDSLFNNSANKRNMKAPHYCPFAMRFHRWLVDFPYKRLVMRKAYFHIKTSPCWARLQMATRGPFRERFFHCNSNSTEIGFCSYPSSSEVITMKFCTSHDNCDVEACVKYCSDMTPNNAVTLKPIFHRILITIQKSFVKWPLHHCVGI